MTTMFPETQPPSPTQQWHDIPVKVPSTYAESTELTVAQANIIEKITTDEELKCASVILAKIHTQLKHIEDARKALVKPLNDHVSFINDQFKVMSSEITAHEDRIKAMMIAYRQMLEINRQRQQAIEDQRAHDKLITGLSPVPEAVALVVPSAPKSVVTPISKTTFRSIWKWKVVDEGKIPREYLEVSQNAITKAVRLGIRDIPGVEVFKEEIPSVRI